LTSACGDLSQNAPVIVVSIASFMKTIRFHCIIDHLISRKHGGLSDPGSLAYACLRCNAWKGSDIGSLDPQTGAFVGLFTPGGIIGRITSCFEEH
jgi:hypothetical protein